ncbi:hypothetical protein EDD92_7293 [Streptomyces sp. TLI_185]|nr:hypothetical protein EDD92_7293 [Streptomyces sp. TLI_185]
MFCTVRTEDTYAACPRACDADRVGNPSAAAAS